MLIVAYNDQDRDIDDVNDFVLVVKMIMVMFKMMLMMTKTTMLMVWFCQT